MNGVIDNQNRLEHVAARIVADTVRASGTRVFLGAVIEEFLDAWSMKGGIRKRIAAPLKWASAKVVKPAEGRPPQTDLAGNAGRLITLLAATLNEKHASASPPAEQDRGRSARAFLENTDFGEILEMVEKSDPYVLKALETFNEELWKYPAKVGTLAATLIALMNTGIKGVRELLLPIEKNIGPDLLADILLSFVKGINGTDAAKLSNTVQELIRRVHTGNLLMGKGGKPLLQIYLTDLLREFLPHLDKDLLRKVRIIFAEDREAIASSFRDALEANPEVTLSRLSTTGAAWTSDIKVRNRRLGTLEDLDGKGLQEAVSESIADLDTFEAATLVNVFCRVLNRIHDARPDAVASILGGIADSVNTDELKATARWLIPDVVSAVKPLMSGLVPELIRGLCELLSPDDVCSCDEHREAINTLRATLSAEGGGR